MDPNAAMDEIRSIVNGIDNRPTNSPRVLGKDIAELHEKVTDLYNWLANGGFLPDRR